MALPLRHVAIRLGAAALLATATPAHAARPVVEVYKSATCSCCHKWIDHLKAHGFEVKATDVPNPGDLRRKFGIAEEHASCHSARVNGYAIEGHVPAADIGRLIKEKPAARGLAVPGMPMGSPGMEGAHADAYDVLLIKKDSSTTVYRHYRGS